MKKVNRLIFVFRELYGSYRLEALALAASGFFAGVFESIGIGAIIPLFSFVIGGDNVADDAISTFIKMVMVFFGIPFNLWTILILIPLLFLLKAFGLLGFFYVRARITFDYENNLRKEMYAEALNTRWSFLVKQKLGHLENLLMTDINASVGLFRNVADIMLDLTSLLSYAIIAFVISPTLILFTFFVGGAFLILIQPLVRRSKEYAYNLTVLNKKIAHYVNENVVAMKIIKALNVTDGVVEIATEFFDKMKLNKVKQAIVLALSSVFLEPSSMVFIVVVFLFSYQKVGFNLAAFTAIVYLIHRMFTYADRVQVLLHKINTSYPHLSIIALAKEEFSKNKEVSMGGEGFSFLDSIEFQKAGFSYGEDKVALRDVNLKIKKGQVVGVIGHSGSGKTTLADLLLRLFELDSGKILIDGKDIGSIELSEWRRKVGYVTQDWFLMNDTIENNIKFFDKTIDKERLIEAVKQAGAYDFINSLPDGFDTVIGDRGIFLSGGERQRINLARVLIQNPDILVLDEVTSALDAESENVIKEMIYGALRDGRRTVVVITHRLPFILDADYLYLMDNGTVVEEGKPKELLEMPNSYFQRMYNIFSDSKEE